MYFCVAAKLELSIFLSILIILPVNYNCDYVLRAPVCKNQTNSKFRGKGGKFDFFHILMSDRLGYN